MESIQTYRPISHVEAEMQKAAVAYRAAEERLRQSQANVHEVARELEEARSQHEARRREYDIALETLNVYQAEMEVSFAALQESSPEASMWQRKEKIAERTSILSLTPPPGTSKVSSSTYIRADGDCINIVSR